MFSKSRRPLSAALLGMSIACIPFGAVYADPAPPYSALLGESLKRAPRVAAAAAAVEQARGLALQARAYPNPSTSLSVENFNGGQPYRGFSQAESTFSVSQPVELWGKRNARIRAGEAGVGAAEARERQAITDYAYELALLYAQAEAASRRATLAQEMDALSREDLRVAQTLVDAGRESLLRLTQARAAATAAAAALQGARADETDAFSRLSALAGETLVFTTVSDSLLTRPAEPVTAASGVDIAQSPAVLAAEAERVAAEERLGSERARWQPDITAGIGVRRFAADGTTALMANVSIPLPVWDQNTGNANAAAGELRGAAARLTAARLDAEAAFRTARFQINAAASRVSAASQAEASAAEAYRLTRVGYEAGSLPLIELLNAQRNLATARNAVIDAQLARVRAEADLARLQGRNPFGG